MALKVRTLLVCGVAIVALPNALHAADTQGGNLLLRKASMQAATAEPAGRSETASVETVTVTGSRIVRSGAEAPTPVTVASSEDLSRLSAESVPAGLAKLPVFAPVKSSNSAFDGGYQPTGNFLDIRGLNPIRTLILQDGHRVPSTYFDGTVDVNTLPQMLIERVEVVTGGASAVYGSDAVAGVANFILDKKFQGFKGNVQGGISTYGDARSIRVGLAGGMDVLSRGHLIGSIEYYNRDPISAVPRPHGADTTSMTGIGTAARPLTLAYNTRLNTATFGGLVTTGPFANQTFAPDGTLVPFNKGAATLNNDVSIGGDGSYLYPANLLPSLQTAQAFGRFDYELSSNTTAYVQASYAQTRTVSRNQNLIHTQGSNALTVYSGNPYLLPQYQAVLTATNTPSFNLARYDRDFGTRLRIKNQTSSLNLNVGIQGTLWGEFNWEAYYTHGQGRTRQATANNVNTQRMYAAVDAVRDPSTGNIVCRVSLTAPGAYPGCTPLNVLGDGAGSQAAFDYISGSTEWVANNTLDDFGANITGTIAEGWAGPIKGAVGVEYRLQSLVIRSSVPNNTFNRQYLRVGLDGNTVSPGALFYTKNVTAPASGANSVYEGNVEFDIPLLKGLPMVELLTLNAAARYTMYSSSGQAQTWKLGIDWQISDELRFRGSRSRDIRAPTLFDLYQGRTATISGAQDFLTGIGGQVVNVTGGNPNLKPEVARNTTAGLVYQPSWLPNFTASIDYFHIVMNNALATISGISATTQKLCIDSGGTSPFCGFLERPFPISNTTPANFPTLNYNVQQNVALTYAEGIDLEVGYTTDLQEFTSLDGFLNARVLWSHQPTLKSQTLPGSVITNLAGTARAPVDRVTFSLGYALDAFNADVSVRYFSPFHQSPDPTLVSSMPDVGSYVQTDLHLSYDFEADDVPLTAYMNVNNLFNTTGGAYQTFTNNPGMQYPSAPFYDAIGRYFSLGLRFKM